MEEFSPREKECRELPEILCHSKLFAHMERSAIDHLLGHTTSKIQHTAPGSFIALEGEPCDHLGIVLSGQVNVKRIHASGREMTITTLAPGDSFGEVMMYSDYRHFPSALVTESGAVWLYVSRQDVLWLCRHSDQFMKNFLQILSNKVWMMNEKLKLLSVQSLRQRIATYLLDRYQEQQSMTLQLPHTRQEMADFLGMPRPSLSREMARMKREGLLEYQRSRVTLVDFGAILRVCGQ